MYDQIRINLERDAWLNGEKYLSASLKILVGLFVGKYKDSGHVNKCA